MSAVSTTAAVGLLLAAVGTGSAQAGPVNVAVGPDLRTAAPTQVQAPVPKLVWRECGDPDGLLCARAKVPLDYDDPNGATISLNLKKRPADKPDQRIGSLFVNPGGPGGPSTRFVADAARLLGAPVRQRFDVIGIDPRGIGGSERVTCRAEPGDPDLPPFPNQAFPLGPKQVTNWLAFDQAVRDLCAKRANPILDHMSTADTARDMDLIRQAVGDPMLTYYGISYGTQLGTTYAAMFPSRVRAMVIDGVLDPVSWTTGRFGTGQRILVAARLGSGTGAWEALTSAFAECDRVGPKRCATAGRIAHQWQKVITRLHSGPIRIAGGRVTYANVIGQILGGLYSARIYPEIMMFIHAVYEAIFSSSAANSRAAGRAWVELKRLVEAAGSTQPGYDAASVDSLAADRVSPTFQAVLCSDSVNPDDESAAVRSARFADRRGPWFGAAWSWISSICIGWPGSSDDAFRGPWPTTTANPILVTGNLHDPATPISGARAVNRLFPGSVMLTVSLWAHGALGESTCAVARWDAYLVSGRLPREGLVCKPDQPLFPIR